MEIKSFLLPDGKFTFRQKANSRGVENPMRVDPMRQCAVDP